MAKKAGSSSNQATRPNAHSRWWIWVVVALLAIGALVWGYRSLGPAPTNKVSHGTKLTAIHEPTLPSSGFTWKYRAYAINSGKPAYLVRGQRITVVMFMASWCLYCAYVDKYVWPAVRNTPGLQLNIVDVSTNSGIGDPGPQSPPFSGKDNVGPTVNTTGMRQVMQTYVKQFHLQQSNTHVFVDPAGISYWKVQYFPTILFLNAKGALVESVSGGITAAKAQSIIQSVLSGH